MPELYPDEIIDVEAEDEPNKTGTIRSTDDVVVKDMHDEGIDNNLYEDN